jgi:hypothetical protein
MVIGLSVYGLGLNHTVSASEMLLVI